MCLLLLLEVANFDVFFLEKFRREACLGWGGGPKTIQ